ncbi:alpha/beta hydrolase [Variovorax sp. J31P207]|uniref:alpha/beta hydrolase n=1 Tax=Variovorax sp. J31P207 TaxID=3053510 RepID=UPI002576E4A9|nr:alpha/beta hydrolase [Variovorax sp. J31P207]MDM0067090.1 alpha/beta hydrolase [Variovorax sp. J31P207]
MKTSSSPKPSPSMNDESTRLAPRGMPLTLRSPCPDRDVRAFLRWLNLAPARIENRSVPTQRKLWRLMALALGRRPRVASVTHRTIAGPGGPIELRIFSAHPSKEPRPAFLWCHGGGFIVGGLDSGDSICRSIALATDCVVIAVRYRLAPEHPLTAGREDFLEALHWVAQFGACLGIDPDRLAIGGDSAGGNICAAVAQHTVRHNGPRLSLQVLAYPATDLVAEFPSLEENASGFLISQRLLRGVVAHIGEIPDADDPWLSPRRQPDLRGLAPAMVISAGFDPIRDDGLDYAARLRAAEVPVDLLHYPGQVHGFLNFDALIDAGRDALHRIACALNKAFSGDAAPDRTIEVADAAPAPKAWPLRPITELLMTSLTGWATAERVWLTLFGRLSPTTDQAARRLLESRLVPGDFLRRSAAAQSHALEARQTWPHATRLPCATSRQPHASSPPSAAASASHRLTPRKRSPKERTP